MVSKRSLRSGVMNQINNSRDEIANGGKKARFVRQRAAAERGMVVGLVQRDLDGSIHQVLRHLGGDDPGAPHG